MTKLELADTLPAGAEKSNIEFYSLPEDKEVLHYLASLGHSLTQTLIQGKFVNKELLLGERNVLNWYLNMVTTMYSNLSTRICIRI